MNHCDDDLLAGVVALAKEAGVRLNALFAEAESLEIKLKADATPLVAADLESHDIITAGLDRIACQYPMVSEELSAADYKTRKTWQRYWLIDPLDGTREFIRGNDEFTVNIALIEDGRPVLGVVYAPAKGECYFALKGKGAFVQRDDEPAQRLQTHAYQTGDCLRLIAGRWHDLERLGTFSSRFDNCKITEMGSALKLCRIASGDFDVCLRLVPSAEWDMAAAHVVLQEAGGELFNFQFQPLPYNQKADFHNPYLIAVGDKSHDWGQYF